MRIDAHVHYTPPELARDLAALEQQEPYWGLLLNSTPGTASLQGWATAERMIEDMDRAGIDRVVLQGEYRQSHDACVARNTQALELTRRWPDRIIAFAMIQPLAGARALAELQRCLDGGMRGVGELGPYAQGFRMDDPAFLRLAEACITHDIPINLHANEEIGHQYLGKAPTPLRHFYELAARYPELKLILAHWGGGLLFYEIMPEVRRVLRNVWYDTAASPLLFPTATIFRQALGAVDPHKLLFGSDYPLLVYPRSQREPDLRPFIAEIEALELAPEHLSGIMGGNAAALLGLELAREPLAAIMGGNAAALQGLEPAMPVQETRLRLASAPEPGRPVTRLSSVAAVAHAWPATQAIFDRYGIPYRDQPVPVWEPIVQAAAAHGLEPSRQQRLVDELNEAISA